MSGIAEKIKETLAGHTTHPEAGHSHGHHAHEHGGIVDRGDTDITGTGGNYGTTTTGSGAGPHSSSLANKLDPRVNAETGNTTGAYGTTGTSESYGSTTGTTGYGSTGTGTTGYGSTTDTSTTGPHSSSLANKLDPRVNESTTGVSGYDSTTRTTGTTGYGSTTGTTGYGSTTGTTDYDSTIGTTSSTSDNSTGPHSSNLLNKLDPRVHNTSERKSSADYGHGPHAGKDTFDAAKVPPSAFQKPAGHPSATMGSKRGSVSGI